jgi:hypothetical protein
MWVTQIFLLFFRNSFSLFDLQLYAHIPMYLHIIHLLKSSTYFELCPAHLQEVCLVIVYMQPLISSLSAGAPVKKESRFFFFVCRHSDLEVSCSNGTKTRHGESRCCLRAVAGHETWHWAGRFETFTERNCWAYDVCAGGGLDCGLFHSRLVSGVGVWGVKYCWNMCGSILAFETSSQFFFRDVV